MPNIWQPTPGTTWQIQFAGDLDTSLDVEVYDVDLFDTPQETIDALHAAGRKVICYTSAGSSEDWRPDIAQFPAEVLGDELDGWPGEHWLDVRQINLLAPIMTARLDLAAAKGCDAVDPDNVDGYTNESGFPLTYDDQLAYNRWTTEQAHLRGLAVGLKNDLNQVGDLVDVYDFAINEQCFNYDECEMLAPFVAANKAVFGIEYEFDEGRFINEVCPQAAAMRFSTLRKERDLNTYRLACPG